MSGRSEPNFRSKRRKIDSSERGKTIYGAENSAVAEFVGDFAERCLVDDLEPILGQTCVKGGPAFILGHMKILTVVFTDRNSR